MAGASQPSVACPPNADPQEAQTPAAQSVGGLDLTKVLVEPEGWL
ncbi:MAG: hypothetical protein R3B03_11455 [Nitrospirales bacterium]